MTGAFGGGGTAHRPDADAAELALTPAGSAGPRLDRQVPPRSTGPASIDIAGRPEGTVTVDPVKSQGEGRRRSSTGARDVRPTGATAAATSGGGGAGR
jgi:hypothetical protein